MSGFVKTSFVVVFSMLLIWTIAGWPRVWLPKKDSSGVWRLQQTRVAKIVSADTGGPNTPSTVAGVASGSCSDNMAWNTTDQTALTSNDTTYISYSAGNWDSGNVTDELRISNFGFSLVGTVTSIDGFQVDFLGWTPSGAPAASYQTVSLFTAPGSNRGDNKAAGTFPTADPGSTYQTFGATNDDWYPAGSWTQAEVESSNFGVALCLTANENNATVNIDQVRITITYTVQANSAPSVSAVDILPSPITLTENGTSTVTITATITDTNGCTDVATNGTTTATLYRSSLGASCSADANNCYTNIPMADAGGTCTGGGDNSFNASGTVQVWYIAQATDASSSFSSDTWQATVKAIDAASASSTATDASPPELNTLLAIDVTGTINYGTVNPDATSTTQTVTITNTGNYNSTDATFSGVNLESGANSIAVGSQRYSTTTNEFWDYLDYVLSGIDTFRELNITKATATTSPSTQSHFWAIKVPLGTAVGTYNGTTTITAQ
ncbi:MAG TPA: hypothetical protein VNK70_01010 [Candidatus Paceibacterota bacterium]|nr:hypothetical protein [Candidatus Paceibacterota bacterium]